jgi:hypothetical protein
VVRGLAGVGKSALLADAVARAEGMQVLRTQGIESESPLAFAALHRLLRPVMRHADRLPAPQSRALRAAFGEVEGDGGDRFRVFLASLSVLAAAAEHGPVLAVIDDAHWLDEASAAAMLFVARRLTVSAWEHRADLLDFERAHPHRTAKAQLRDLLAPSTLVVWTCATDQLPIRWDEVRARITAIDTTSPDRLNPPSTNG